MDGSTGIHVPKVSQGLEIHGATNIEYRTLYPEKMISVFLVDIYIPSSQCIPKYPDVQLHSYVADSPKIVGIILMHSA